MIRKAIIDTHSTGSTVKIGDVSKAAKKVYELSEMPQPPLRVILGKDAAGALHQQLELIRKDLEISERWAGDLQED